MLQAGLQDLRVLFELQRFLLSFPNKSPLTFQAFVRFNGGGIRDMDTFEVHRLVKDWVLLAAFLSFFAWVVYVAATTIRRRQQNAMQRHLLDKFSSAKDFAEFVQSPAGQKYVMSFTDAVSSPRNAIANSVKTGIVLIFLGGGILSGGGAGRLVSVFQTVGIVLVCVGTGFLVSALVAHFLAKKMGPEEKL